MVEHTFSIAVVDDDRVIREVFSSLLEELGTVTTFPTGEAFLEGVGALRPDIVLLDIGLPRLDGYAVCRKFRALPDLANVPVIFVSAYDTPEDRITAYGAGGDDFVVKSADPEELRIKVTRFARLLQNQASLDAVSRSAQSAAFAAMMSMSEQGQIIDFLRRSFGCQDYDSLAGALAEALNAYDIEGMLQLRGSAGTIERNMGEAQSLETSVLASMSGMGRIVEFRSRAVVNYESASILVRNLPVDDSDKVGRLKDHLAILAEVTDARVKAIDDRERLRQQTRGLGQTLSSLRHELAEFRERNQKFSYAHRLAFDEIRGDVEVALTTLALSADQERRMLSLAERAEASSAASFDQLMACDRMLSKVVEQLENL